jgi:hypothetical protein
MSSENHNLSIYSAVKSNPIIPAISISEADPAAARYVSVKRTQCKWNEAMEDALLDFRIEFMSREAERGKSADCFFRKKTWDEAVVVVNKVLPQNWVHVPAPKIRQKCENMKKDFDAYHHMKIHFSAWEWDEETQTIKCDEETWREYVAVHKHASKFRKRGLRNYDKMYRLFIGAGERPGKRQRVASRHTVPSTEESLERHQDEDEEKIGDALELGEASTASVLDLEILQTPVCEAPSRRSASTVLVSGDNEAVDGSPCSVSSNKWKRPFTGDWDQPDENMTTNTLTSFGVTVLAKAISDSKVKGVRFQAVERLQKDYTRELSDGEMVHGFRIFENEGKAEMFLGMNPGPARTAWLQYEIHLQNQLSGPTQSNLPI